MNQKPNAGTTPGIRNGPVLREGAPIVNGSSTTIREGVNTTTVENPALVEPALLETPSPKDPPLTTRGGAPPENPISQGILNLLFICFLYWVSTKILLFYGISNDIYLVYFMFYVFLYATTLLLPTSYERFD
jgi:hypothetical protein